MKFDFYYSIKIFHYFYSFKVKESSPASGILTVGTRILEVR
jgi:hypothetical protein